MSSEERQEKILDVIIGFMNAVEAAAYDAKRQIAELHGVKEAVAVKEETFSILKFSPQKGERLGDFEIAIKADNLSDKWQSAYNILRQSNATISDRYHGKDYAFSYWLYGQDQIYRQKLKGPEAKTTPAAAPTAAPSNIFPKDLADMLSFEEQPEAIIIRPRLFLGSENFAKIAAIVKEHKGEYISAGKESHFRVPKAAAK